MMKRSNNLTIDSLTVDEIQDRIDDLTKQLSDEKTRMSRHRAQTNSKAAKQYEELADILNKLDDITDKVSSVQVKTTIVCHLSLPSVLTEGTAWFIGETEVIDDAPINAALKEWKVVKTKARKLIRKIGSITGLSAMEIIAEANKFYDQKLENEEARAARPKTKGR